MRQERVDTGELERFCRGEYPRVVGALSLYCGDAGLALEFAQDVMAIACRDWHRLQRADIPGAWLQRVAMNVANSYFRRRAAERRAVAKLDVEGSHERDDASAIAVRQLVSELPRRQRAAVVLRFFCDFSVRETAEAMGCAEGTVKALTYKGIERLRQRMESTGAEAMDAI